MDETDQKRAGWRRLIRGELDGGDGSEMSRIEEADQR
jgi:hypothetical protein